MDIQGLIWFTGGSGTEEGAGAGFCGHGTKLFFFFSVKRYVKGSLETGVSVHRWLQRGTWGVERAPLPGTLRDR